MTDKQSARNLIEYLYHWHSKTKSEDYEYFTTILDDFEPDEIVRRFDTFKILGMSTDIYYATASPKFSRGSKDHFAKMIEQTRDSFEEICARVAAYLGHSPEDVRRACEEGNG